MFQVEQLVSTLAVVTNTYRSDYTLTGNDDYTPGPYTVTFPAGVTSATFDVPIISDNLLEGNENFVLVINDSSLPSLVIRGSPGAVTVNMVDDDSKLKFKITYKICYVV